MTAIPAGLSGNVIAIAAGYDHSLAVKSDGTVVAWGDNSDGQINVPAGLNSVTAITSGFFYSLAITTDSTGPSVTLNQAAGQADPTSASPITFTVVFGEDVTGFTSSDVALSGTAGATNAVVTGSGSTYNIAVSGMSTSGTVIVSIPAGAVQDAAGNPSTAATSSDNTVSYVQPDSTPPVITSSISGTAGSNGWYVGDVTVSWSVSDAESTISSQTDCGSITLSSDTSGVTFTCVATSAGGTTSKSVTVKRDATNPSISFVSRTAPNATGWNNSAVTITWTCGDATSGVVSACISQTLSSEGANQSSTGTCTDNAGNTTSNTQIGISIDKTSPSLNPIVSPNPVLLNGSATVTSGAVDTLSGLASQSCDTLDTSSVGSKSVACTATDNAGNIASASASYTVLPAFPTSTVLDTFNRANGGLGRTWAGLTDKAFYSIASNRLDVQAGGPIVWKSAFGVSQEAFVTLSTIDPKSPSTGLLLKVQDNSRAEAGAILVVYDAKAKVVRVSAIRVGAREWTAYPNQAATFANGDVLGARAKADGTVAIYKNGTLIATITLNSADKAFFNAKGGKIGLWALGAPKAFFDDFGGGTVTP